MVYCMLFIICMTFSVIWRLSIPNNALYYSFLVINRTHLVKAVLILPASTLSTLVSLCSGASYFPQSRCRQFSWSSFRICYQFLFILDHFVWRDTVVSTSSHPAVRAYIEDCDWYVYLAFQPTNRHHTQVRAWLWTSNGSGEEWDRGIVHKARKGSCLTTAFRVPIQINPLLSFRE